MTSKTNIQTTNKKPKFNTPLQYLALTDKNKEDLKRSSSGGAFMVLARPIIEQNGVVFGCKLDNDGTCYHTYATTYQDLKAFQGSKYVQSKIGNTYKECASFIKEGKQVLYSGTPCMIAGLYAYLNKTKATKKALNNLLTVDLFCHGTPPNKFFKLYIKWLKNKLHADNITNYQFHSKITGWKAGVTSYDVTTANSNNSNNNNNKNNNNKQTNKQTKVIQGNKDIYYRAFIKSNCLQEKCYNCKYSTQQRISDISIGDFWGIEKSHPQFDQAYHDQGISAVSLNTSKGEEYFNKNCTDTCKYIKSTYALTRQAAIDGKNNAVQIAGDTTQNERKAIKDLLKDNNENELFNNMLRIKKSELFFNYFKRAVAKITPAPVKKQIKNILRGKRG